MQKKKAESGSGRMLRIIGDQKGLLVFTILITAAGKICLAIAPGLTGRITDALSNFVATGVLDHASVLFLALVTAIFYFFGNGVDGIVQRNMVEISQTLSRRLRDLVAEKLLRVPVGYLDTHPMGDLQALATSDIVNIGNSMESSVPVLFGQGILLIGVFIMMCLTNVRLALIYMAILPVLMSLMLIISRASQRFFDQQIQAEADLNASVAESCSNHLIIRAYNCEGAKKAEFERKNQAYFRSYARSRFVSGFLIPLGSLGGNFPFIALCLIGGKMMIEGTLTIGQFQAFIFFGNMLTSPLTSISASVNGLLQAFSAMRRLDTFLNEPEDVDKGQEMPPVKGNVEFEHVQFGYVPGKLLMHDVSFSVRAGETVAIVGPSGAGKTTLINLLMRFYEISGGEIRLDGRNIAGLSRDDVRSAFGMVLQDAWIFDGTVAENIAYGKPDASREEIIRAAQIANCDDFIRKLPMGYDTPVSSDHSALSAGEMQLLTIARCVLSDPEILILDEATSQVDSRTEYLITQAMNKLMEGRTCFIIAHRLFTIRHADRIIFMKDGDIREVGTHRELMQKGGGYAEMYRESREG
ncbi:MAG: ABC transporter ATP-binding protein [Clostridia bacterium]|nr:ABC transporter ATP-binding protein [Clostridia bacterium]